LSSSFYLSLDDAIMLDTLDVLGLDDETVFAVRMRARRFAEGELEFCSVC
jgi:hypothetical protein